LMKRLIVNADDFGMNLEVSRGIIDAARGGIVRSTSAMANAPDLAESAELLRSSGLGLDAGFHANLTFGRPVLDPSEIPTLVGPDGAFLGRKRLLLRAIAGGVSVDEAYRELRAQCERLASLGIAPSHIDGHHHVHAFPTICRAAERVAQRFGIRCVRAPYEGAWTGLSPAPLRRLAIAALPASYPAYWRGRSFATPDRFGGFGLSGRPSLKRLWIDALRRIGPGVTEIMAHPGYPAPSGDSYNRRRRYEVEALSDPGLMEEIERLGIELISFSDLLRRQST